MKKIKISMMLFLSAYPINAQEIITDRPDQTESSSTIPRGSLQIESGILIRFLDLEEVFLQEIFAPTTLFRFGLTEQVELRIVNQLISIKDKNNPEENFGIGDLEIGTKIQIYKKERANMEIAFLSHVVLPTGSKGLTIDKVGTINKLSISHKLKPNINLGYNIGYNYFGSENGFITYSLALGIGITPKVAIYLEPYGEIGIFEEHILNFDAGITYLLRDNFQLDFSFGTGINNKMNYIAAGFSWNISQDAK